MIDQIPLHESLKCTAKRSSVYWDTVIAPSLSQGKTVLVVGHENNLRSLLMRLENIPEKDIIQLNLPRSIPLAYKLDENLNPVNPRTDGSLDDATGFLRGSWLSGDAIVSKILERDYRQVYDTSNNANESEFGSSGQNGSVLGSFSEPWQTWVDLSSDKPADATMEDQLSDSHKKTQVNPSESRLRNTKDREICQAA
jgi:hypothetical protein